MTSLSQNVETVLIAMPNTIILTGIFSTLITANYSGVLFSAWAVTVSLLNIALKFPTKHVFGGGKRPSGCGGKINGLCKGCGTYFKGGVSSTWGMPSGHAQSITWAATFATLWCVGRTKNGKQSKYNLTWQLPLVWLIAIGVCIQRSPLWSNCHSYPQILVGCIVGGLLGVGTYSLSTEISSENFPSAWRTD